jgi:hypothetical protein
MVYPGVGEEPAGIAQVKLDPAVVGADAPEEGGLVLL